SRIPITQGPPPITSSLLASLALGQLAGELDPVTSWRRQVRVLRQLVVGQRQLLVAVYVLDVLNGADAPGPLVARPVARRQQLLALLSRHLGPSFCRI